MLSQARGAPQPPPQGRPASCACGRLTAGARLSQAAWRPARPSGPAFAAESEWHCDKEVRESDLHKLREGERAAHHQGDERETRQNASPGGNTRAHSMLEAPSTTDCWQRASLAKLGVQSACSSRLQARA